MKIITETGQEISVGAFFGDQHPGRVTVTVNQPGKDKAASAVLNRIEWAALVAAGEAAFK